MKPPIYHFMLFLPFIFMFLYSPIIFFCKAKFFQKLHDENRVLHNFIHENFWMLGLRRTAIVWCPTLIYGRELTSSWSEDIVELHRSLRIRIFIGLFIFIILHFVSRLFI